MPELRDRAVTRVLQRTQEEAHGVEDVRSDQVPDARISRDLVGLGCRFAHAGESGCRPFSGSNDRVR